LRLAALQQNIFNSFFLYLFSSSLRLCRRFAPRFTPLRLAALQQNIFSSFFLYLFSSSFRLYRRFASQQTVNESNGHGAEMNKLIIIKDYKILSTLHFSLPFPRPLSFLPPINQGASRLMRRVAAAAKNYKHIY
jgi:hypothetical protein